MKLIIGYGNTLRQDDGIGWLVAQHFISHQASTDLHVMCVHQLMPEITLSIAEADRVIFVDACVDGEAGDVMVNKIEPAKRAGDAHALQPSELLYLASLLYERTPEIYLVTVTGVAFDLGEVLSEAVQNALPEAVKVVELLLEA